MYDGLAETRVDRRWRGAPSAVVDEDDGTGTVGGARVLDSVGTDLRDDLWLSDECHLDLALLEGVVGGLPARDPDEADLPDAHRPVPVARLRLQDDFFARGEADDLVWTRSATSRVLRELGAERLGLGRVDHHARLIGKEVWELRPRLVQVEHDGLVIDYIHARHALRQGQSARRVLRILVTHHVPADGLSRER
jgi:hypothetical protein